MEAISPVQRLAALDRGIFLRIAFPVHDNDHLGQSAAVVD
jgi:hypothetical protein